LNKTQIIEPCQLRYNDGPPLAAAKTIFLKNLAVKQQMRYTVNTVTTLQAPRPRNRGSLRDMGKRFSLLPRTQTGCRAHPASYSVVSEAPFPVVNCLCVNLSTSLKLRPRLCASGVVVLLSHMLSWYDVQLSIGTSTRRWSKSKDSGFE
jgi:hypothetical protein